MWPDADPDVVAHQPRRARAPVSVPTLRDYYVD
jgi:hypothetical protein